MGCHVTDITCICKDKSYTSSLHPVIKQPCSAEDYRHVSSDPLPSHFPLTFPQVYLSPLSTYPKRLRDCLSKVNTQLPDAHAGTQQFTQQLCGSVGVSAVGEQNDTVTAGAFGPTATNSPGAGLATTMATGNGALSTSRSGAASGEYEVKSLTRLVVRAGWLLAWRLI